jgi:hypothetical protein
MAKVQKCGKELQRHLKTRASLGFAASTAHCKKNFAEVVSCDTDTSGLQGGALVLTAATVEGDTAISDSRGA